MPRPCGVCSHGQRTAIEEALTARRDSLRDMARQYGVSKDALDRHRRRHMGPPVEASRVEAPNVAIDPATLSTRTPAQDRRATFVREYLLDLNATQAAIRAAYSPRSAGSQASELLKDPRIQDAIQAGMDARAARVGMTADEVLRELKVIGLSRVDHYEIGDARRPLVATDQAPPDAIGAVSSVKRRVRRVERDDGQTEEVEDVEFKLWNKPEALRLAGQHLKLFGATDEGGGAVEKVFFLPVIAVNVED